MSDKNLSRRTFIQSMAVALPAGAAVLQNEALAADMPKLDPEDPTAKALVYVHDAADVDTSNPLAARFETRTGLRQLRADSGRGRRRVASVWDLPGQARSLEGLVQRLGRKALT